MYFIISFDKDNDVALVPETWMAGGNKKCFWPPFRNQQRIVRAVRESSLPNKEEWAVYDVKVMYSSTSFEKARKKLPMAEETSDLYTEDEVGTPIRKKRQNTRYITSSEDEEEKTPEKKRKSGSPIHRLPVPPAKPTCSGREYTTHRHNQRATTPPLQNTTEDNSEMALLSNQEARQSPRSKQPKQITRPEQHPATPTSQNMPAVDGELPRLCTPQPRRSPRSKQPTSLTQQQRSSTPPRRNLDNNEQPGPSTSRPRGSPTSPELTALRWQERSTTPPRQNTHGDIIGSVRMLMVAIENNTAKVEENTRLLHQLLRMMPASAPEIEGPNIQLPIRTQEELREAEEALTDPPKFRNMVHVLGIKGGQDVKESVGRIMGEMVDHQLALKMNCNGSPGKTSFKSMSRLRNVVIQATRRNPAVRTSTEKEIEARIQLWFRYAADREGGKKARLLRKALQDHRGDNVNQNQN